jgi:hypothetical protein
MNNNKRIYMNSPKVAALTKHEIASTARTFQWARQMPKWTVIVDGRELPARPLVLEAAGVPPNDPTNSHQAVALLKDRGFVVHYQGKPILDGRAETSQPVSDEFIRNLRGSLNGPSSMVEEREREHRIEKNRLER